MSEKITVVLSNRPPVRIDEADWPRIATASEKDYDNQYEFQANQVSRWSVTVRQHEDGRAIVYAVYSYSSNWQGSRGYSAKAGQLLSADCDTKAIVAAINEVCGEIAACEHYGEDAARWVTLARDCIADLPAEELS